MKLDPLKLVRQRQRLGYSQQNVVDKSKVNLRTVQRAEAGISVSNESAASIAAALQTTPHALAASSASAEPTIFGKTLTLRRVSSGRALIDSLDQTAMSKIECEVEPTKDNLELLKALASLLETNMPEPLNEDKLAWPPPRTLAERLDLIAQINDAVRALEGIEVGVFAAETWLDAHLPDYDPYEGGFYYRRDKPASGCRAVRIVISDQTADKIVRPIDVRWPVAVETEDDEVPF